MNREGEVARQAFLTARWVHLLLATYAVPVELVASVLPAGLEPDVRDGRAFASLVAFDFRDTRVLGVPWPGFRNFPEVNLRVYVRRLDGSDRGVLFVREFVPQRWVAWLARTLYNEPYQATSMASRVEPSSDGNLAIEHRWTFAGRTHAVRATADPDSSVPDAGGLEAFFKEHRWGYGRTRDGRLLRYEVRHPPWATHRVRSFDVDVDWSAAYGSRWSELREAKPFSTIVAAGSDVSVHRKELLEATANPALAQT
jgi:uncharacterized protein YqjF (DUF2071 family)